MTGSPMIASTPAWVGAVRSTLFDAPEFDDDRDAVWARALDAGVREAVIPAVEPATWDATLACALPRERYAALGVHPQYLSRLDDAALDAALASLEGRVREAGARVVAIGECGFDGSTDALRATLERQRRVFLAQVEVARSLGLPLVVHVLKAHGEALAAMRAVALPPQPGVVHSFSGGAELAREYLALGWHLALGGSVTRPRARRPVEAARVIPRSGCWWRPTRPIRRRRVPPTACDAASRRT